MHINYTHDREELRYAVVKDTNWWYYFWIYLTDPKLALNPDVLKLVKDLRGGGWDTIFFIGMIIFILSQGAGFIPNNPGWGVDGPNPFQPPGGPLRYPPISNVFSPRRTPSYSRPETNLEIHRPSTMPHEEFGGLTKSERRALPHSYDMTIIHEGRPELWVGLYQAKFKVGEHGSIHDLPYTLKAGGKTKTERTTANALKMMQSIVNMPNRDNVRWFEDGTYQGVTDRGFAAILIYDEDRNIITMFKKSKGKFVTTYQLNPEEHDELMTTGNFGGETKLYSGQG